jgi:excisionase family DNA binding protein
MRSTGEEYQSDRRKMKAYIARLLPEEGTRIVLADGPDGEVWVDLDPIRHADGEWDLHWETNCREAIGLQEIYDHFRRQVMTVEERRRELAEKEVVTTTMPTSRIPKEPTGRPIGEKKMLTTKEVAILLDCSYGEARKRMLEGRIRAIKDGRWLRTSKEWLDEYVAKIIIKPAETQAVVPVPLSRRKGYANVKSGGIGHRFLQERKK